MKLAKTLGSLAKIAIIVGIAYAALNWKDLGLMGDDVRVFAERACVDAVRERYDVSRVSTYSFARNSNGFVVGATATLRKGGNAKISCLHNAQGGIRDIVITE